MSRLRFALVLTTLFAACTRSSMVDTDAGERPDADLTTRDATVEPDSAPMPDATAAPDLGTADDLGVLDDAGPGEDLGFRRDGGPPDLDAGDVDGGAPDAGPPDAGRADATAGDAATHDASSGDASVGDAATHDASSADASFGDAGAADATVAYDAALGDASAPSGCAAGIDDVVAATITLTTDNFSAIYVNGVLVDGTHYDWRTHQVHTVSLYRHPSRVNVIALDSLNTETIDGRDRGVILELRANVGGTDRVLVSDATWLFSMAPDTGWSDVVFDTSAWGTAVDEGANGVSPWGAVLGTSTAHWLWAYDSNLPAGSKTAADEHVYFRRTFSFDDAGALTDTPGVCP